ncbi:Copper transport protein ATOX1 [Gossypium australe]|uniref:Copper transport protein ATOX1 n=1 Tax=Gossypium australe TaxID=47621 RepID=A0A5B6V6E0_9ROSI|nr:Copper transport protein ATOX1 [Gossypium australe]
MSQVFIGSSQIVVLKVGMSCQGCVGAVKRVLGKMEGVESYEVDLEQQKVTVKGNVQPDAVLQTVSKTGKKTAFWEAEALAETEAKPAETEVKPAETEVKPAETEAKPAEPEAKPTEAVAAA